MISRRRFVAKPAKAVALYGPAMVMFASLALPGGASAARKTTPSQAEGPFYPVQKPDDRDWNLLRFMSQKEVAKGTPLELSGQITDTDGAPITDAVVEIWQCDHQGIYRHPDARNNDQFDPTFQGYGETKTDQNGAYRFLTLVPAIYTGRPPHIHVKIRRQGDAVLTTQLYIKGHPENGRDGILASLFFRNQDQLLMDLKDHEIAQIGPGKRATFNFVV